MPTIKEAFTQSNEDRIRNMLKSEDVRIFYRVISTCGIMVALGILAGVLFGKAAFWIVLVSSAVIWQVVFTTLLKYQELLIKESTKSE